MARGDILLVGDTYNRTNFSLPMLKIKKLNAEHVYMVRGASVANSPFFETEDDCRLFLDLVDRFLKDYMFVNCFQNNRDGWAMIIATKSIEQIKKAYKERRAKSKKCKKSCEYKEVWKILSDQVRILLSTYVKATNYKTGRKGGKVRCNYERFVFESEEEALEMKMKLENERYNQEQPRKRYRSAKKLSKLREKLIRVSPFVSCAPLAAPEKMLELGLGCLDRSIFVSDVLRQLIQTTLLYHFPT